MPGRFSRTELIFGREAIENLSKCRVAIFGIGGVGGYAAEALVRSGIGAIDIIDNDKVCTTNINRQIFATTSTVGMYKVDTAEKRLLDINQSLKVYKHKCFFTQETSKEFDFSQYDYVIDAIDTVTGKIEIIMCARDAGVPVISAMGAGNKTDPSKLRVTDIYKTTVCPLARVMRHELRRRGVDKLKVVYSEEEPVRSDDAELSFNVGCDFPPGTEHTCSSRRDIPGSTAFVPPAAGLMIASEVVRDLIAKKAHEKTTTQ